MTPRAPAFVSFKDHDPKFNQNKKVRVINPNKPELGRAISAILKRVNAELRALLGVNQ